MASLSDAVPIITLSGLSKRFLLPGWRFGWIALHDPLHVADSVKEGMAVWANRFFGPSSVAQAALPAILETPAEWHNEVLAKIKVGPRLLFIRLTSRGIALICSAQRRNHVRSDQPHPRSLVHPSSRRAVHARPDRL